MENVTVGNALQCLIIIYIEDYLAVDPIQKNAWYTNLMLLNDLQPSENTISFKKYCM